MSNLPTLVICAAESIMKQVPVFAVCSDTFRLCQERKFNYFLDEVKKGTANLDFDTLYEYDILHNAYLTQLALLKIRQNEKIKLLAKLFSSYSNKVSIESSKIKEYSDDYEQLLLIIEQISLEEWQILLTLYDWEQDRLQQENTEINWDNWGSKWGQFFDKIKCNMGLDRNYVLAVLTKLNSTGLCIKTSVGMNFSGELSIEKLTPIFYKLVKFVS